MSSLLTKLKAARQCERERLREETRSALQHALNDYLPDSTVILFGSLTKPGKFHNLSDVDLALMSEPVTMSRFELTSRLEESLRRPVDVVVLEESRFRDKIMREGETWTS